MTARERAELEARGTLSALARDAKKAGAENVMLIAEKTIEELGAEYDVATVTRTSIWARLHPSTLESIALEDF